MNKLKRKNKAFPLEMCYMYSTQIKKGIIAEKFERQTFE